MPTDPRKRQKKLERRTAKRQEKKHRLVREQHAGLPERLTAATKYPVLDALVTEDFWTEGMGWVLLSRALPDGSIALAIFLVDRYCLGVKDALADIVGRYSYDNEFLRKMRSQFTSRVVSPATARKLVEAAVAYAADLGLPPHPDYQKAKHIFGTIDAAESTEQFEFGKDGQPLFIAGPSDTPERCRQILAVLTHSRGPNGFHYLIPGFADVDRILPEALRRRPTHLVGPDDEGGMFDLPVDFGEDDAEKYGDPGRLVRPVKEFDG